MTPYKNFSQPSSWKSRARRGGLFLAVAAMIGSATSCGSNDNNGGDWEEVTVQEPTKGVVTTLEETTPGQYEVVDEKVVGAKDSSKIVIKKLDGTVQTLNLDQAKAMVQASDTSAAHGNTQHYHSGGGFGRFIWWSAMGYMIGRSFSSPVQSSLYRNGMAAGAGAFGASRGSSIGSELQRTSVSRTIMRPASGRSGFFGGSGRARSSGAS